MKPSLGLLKAQPRLLAKEVLANVERMKQIQPQPTDNSQMNPFFAQLPKNLANFFKKYPPPPYHNYSDKPTKADANDANPFLPNKHPVTNRWSAPKFSLRRQSDLYKTAYRFGITHLLPTLLNGKKFYEDKHQNKTPVRGSLSFKLSKGERIKESRKAEVDEAVANMDEIIAKHRGKAYKKKVEKKKAQPEPWY